MQDLFIELLQVSIGTRDGLSRVPSVPEWEGIFAEAQRQAVAGVMMAGLELIPESQRPPKIVKLQWIGLCQQLEMRNAKTTDACVRLCEQLCQDGFRACVMKGQANHRYYPEIMRLWRSCGDVDVWVQPNKGDGLTVSGYGNPVRTVLEYVRSHFDMNGLCWLHTSHVGKNGVPVEIHFRPSFMNEPCKNRRFLRHFGDIEQCRITDRVDGVELPVMRVDEDVIYQMNHIYRHLIDEGVGLRQIVDYFFLLCTWNERHERTKEETMKIVEHLGMKRFASALMYVLHELLGMDEESLLCPASIEDGCFLQNEILLSGNFGHDDPRMKDLGGGGGYLSSRLRQAWRRFKRNLRFLTSYAGEVIWEPYTRVAHFIWKKLELWKY